MDNEANRPDIDNFSVLGGQDQKENDTPADNGRMSASENPEDESGIILDQDQTSNLDPNESERYIGAEGNDNPPLSETSEFLRGEVDLVDQMDRAIRAHDLAAGKNRHPEVSLDRDLP